jgi:hypothetical protein
MYAWADLQGLPRFAYALSSNHFCRGSALPSGPMTDLPAGAAAAVRLLLADLDGAALERVADVVRDRDDAAVAVGDVEAHTAMSAMSALVAERLVASAQHGAGGEVRRA